MAAKIGVKDDVSGDSCGQILTFANPYERYENEYKQLTAIVSELQDVVHALVEAAYNGREEQHHLERKLAAMEVGLETKAKNMQSLWR